MDKKNHKWEDKHVIFILAWTVPLNLDLYP